MQNAQMEDFMIGEDLIKTFCIQVGWITLHIVYFRVSMSKFCGRADQFCCWALEQSVADQMLA